MFSHSTSLVFIAIRGYLRVRDVARYPWEVACQYCSYLDSHPNKLLRVKFTHDLFWAPGAPILADTNLDGIASFKLTVPCGKPTMNVDRLPKGPSAPWHVSQDTPRWYAMNASLHRRCKLSRASE